MDPVVVVVVLLHSGLVETELMELVMVLAVVEEAQPLGLAMVVMAAMVRPESW